MKRSGDIASLFGNHEAKTMEIPESSSSSNVFIGDETPVPEEEPRQVPTDAFPRAPPVQRNASSVSATMDRRPGRHKLRRVKAHVRAARMDRISGLPDKILHHIMSFLNARQAVQTCVLSRRWRNLWRTMPCINADFDEFDFIAYQGDDEDYNDEVAFKRFVNQMLELRDPTAMIDTFWLSYIIWDGYNEYKDSNVDANRWISHALQKQARVIEVVVFAFPLELDHSVFTSCYLRKIGFSCVSLHQGFFKQLDTGCPALEELFLHDCIIADEEILSQSLKVLTIDGTEFSMANKASISIPSVTSLTLSIENSTPMLKDMELLTTASVSVKFNTFIFSYGFDANDLRQCLWSLSGVTNLEFNYEGTELTFENNLQWCPEFIDVVNLTLGQWCLDANFYALIVFLQNSPRLEKLTLNLAKCIADKSPRIVGELMERSFTCEHLKIVEVKCLEDDPQVISVEDFFASNGMASVQFDIKHWGQYEDELPAFIRYEER